MSLLDIILGRTKPVRSKTEQLFAISTAVVTLETKLGLHPAPEAGIVFRPVQSSSFRNTSQEVQDLLDLSARDTNSRVRQVDDEFNFRWIIIEDEDFEDLVTMLHMVTLTLAEHGYQNQLLAAVFRFDGQKGPVYWIYNYKRGAFYPFVPTGNRRRDNATELQLQAVMDKELPIDPTIESWYALWGIPI
jgi:hypothetical protein